MGSSKSPLTQALSRLVVPWARQEGFAARTPYLLVRDREDIGAKEVIDIQRSLKLPYRTFTVNLGLFHPDYCEDAPREPKELSCVHCGREVRIGHLMSKSPWFRASLWYRYGSGWDFLDALPGYGDFWWQYGKTLDEAIPPVRSALDQIAAVGLRWFAELRRHRAAGELFDPRGYAWYELPGACAKGVDLRLKRR